MENKLKENKIEYNWGKLENILGYKLPKSFKDFHEKYGPVGIDDYIYIVGADKTESSDSLSEQIEYTKYVYEYLESSQLDDFIGIDFYDGTEGWLPVGYTTNGDTIFCKSKEVMVADEGFEEREIYEGSIEEFIERYFTGKLEYEVTSPAIEDGVSDIEYYRQDRLL